MAERKRSTPAQSEPRPADIPGAPPGELPRLGYLLKTAQLRFMAQTSAALAPLGVDTRQWAALACLGDERHLSQGQIAVLTKKDNGLIKPVQQALQYAIDHGLYQQVLARWGLQSEAVHASVINPPGLPKNAK